MKKFVTNDYVKLNVVNVNKSLKLFSFFMYNLWS